MWKIHRLTSQNFFLDQIRVLRLSFGLTKRLSPMVTPFDPKEAKTKISEINLEVSFFLVFIGYFFLLRLNFCSRTIEQVPHLKSDFFLILAF